MQSLSVFGRSASPSLAAGPTLPPELESKPQLISLDSSQEFTIDHLICLYNLVETEDRDLKGYVFDDELVG